MFSSTETLAEWIFLCKCTRTYAYSLHLSIITFGFEKVAIVVPVPLQFPATYFQRMSPLS
jgi:hypothetical protein